MVVRSRARKSHRQYDLACMLARGRGPSVDRQKATILFQKAADGGDLDARKWIEIAKGKPSPGSTIFWYTHRRSMQDATQAERLRLSYREPIDGDQEFVALCRSDAEDGAAVDFTLGLIFETGKMGHPKDDRQAASFYEMASARGHAIAQTHLAYLYASGRGVPLDPAKAVSLFRSAAEKGERIALSNLARFYETGEMLFPRDATAAYALYGLAAARGDGNIAPKALSLLSAKLTEEERKKAIGLRACMTREGGSHVSLQCLDEMPCYPDPRFEARQECR